MMKPKAYCLRRRICRIAVMTALCIFLTAFGAVLASATETDTGETLSAVPYTGSQSSDPVRGEATVVSPGLKVLAAREEMVFSGLCGNEITLTAEDICRAMNISELQYITVKTLPSADDGILYVGSVGAAGGQVISAGSLSSLSFAAADDTKPCTATLSLSVNGSGYDMTCRFCLLPALNYTPTVSLAPEVSLSLETFADLTAVGTLSSYDPDGDQLTYEIVRYASHGRVSLTDKHTGAYTYVPDKGYTGSDAFSYVVRDEYGNYSTSTVVSITVSPRPTQPAFADIENCPAAASILKVSMNGLMNGTTVGGVQYFKPDASVSRVEFLVTAMHAAGITSDDVQTLGAPSFADASEIPEGMAKYVSLAVRRGYVMGKEVDGKLCFKPHESISKAEAAVILSNIIGYAKQTTVTAFADADALPAWSVKALTSLKSLGILAPGDGNADAQSTMTREDTALWLDRTIQVMASGK